MVYVCILSCNAQKNIVQFYKVFLLYSIGQDFFDKQYLILISKNKN